MMIHLAARPPSEEHAYGFKAEYFASGFEGALIFLAAIATVAAAVERLHAPRALEQLNIGLLLSGGDGGEPRGGTRADADGRQRNSIALEADGRHLMTDAHLHRIIVALVAVPVNGWQWLDRSSRSRGAEHSVDRYRLLRRSRWACSTCRSCATARCHRLGAGALRREGIKFHALRTLVKPRVVPSSPCTCWSRVRGPCSAATICWRRSNAISAARCPPWSCSHPGAGRGSGVLLTAT